MTPCKMQNLLYEWVNFQNCPKFDAKFKEILEKLGNFAQNLAQKWANWYMNGSLFLEKLVLVWVNFQILQYVPTKTNLDYLPSSIHTKWFKLVTSGS